MKEEEEEAEEKEWTGQEQSRDDNDIRTKNSDFKIQSCWLHYWGLWSSLHLYSQNLKKKSEVMKCYLQISIS